jgi:hypothetical protein
MIPVQQEFLARLVLATVSRRSDRGPPQVAQSSAVRSRSRKILAGKFGWGMNEPLQIAGVGLID